MTSVVHGCSQLSYVVPSTAACQTYSLRTYSCSGTIRISGGKVVAPSPTQAPTAGPSNKPTVAPSNKPSDFIPKSVPSSPIISTGYIVWTFNVDNSCAYHYMMSITALGACTSASTNFATMSLAYVPYANPPYNT